MSNGIFGIIFILFFVQFDDTRSKQMPIKIRFFIL